MPFTLDRVLVGRCGVGLHVFASQRPRRDANFDEARISECNAGTLSAVSLFADSEERPVQWDTVFSADYGPDIAELGSIVAREQGAPNFPRSFAIDNDGSVWILDAVKHRIAHYSQQGVFAGSLDGGLRLDPHHPYPIDMAVIGRSVYVLLEETLRQWVVVPSRGGVEGRTSLVHDGVNPLIYEFVSSQPRLTRITLGSWDGTDVSGDPGVAWFDVPGSGRMHTLPGIPLVDGWVLCRADGGDLFLEYTGQDGRSQPRTSGSASFAMKVLRPTGRFFPSPTKCRLATASVFFFSFRPIDVRATTTAAAGTCSYRAMAMSRHGRGSPTRWSTTVRKEGTSAPTLPGMSITCSSGAIVLIFSVALPRTGESTPEPRAERR